MKGLDLETKQLVKVEKDERGRVWALGLPELNEEDEDLVEEVLGALRVKVRARRLQLWYYFRQYDAGGSTSHTRLVTAAQFARALAALGIIPSPKYLSLLLLKFLDVQTGYIRYPAFVQAMDGDEMQGKASHGL